MKIIKIAFALSLGTILFSCSGSTKDAKLAAEKYATEYILPLLPDASIRDFENRLGKSQTPVVFVKSTDKQIGLAADISQANMDYMNKRQEYLGYRTESIVQNLKISGQRALTNADASAGFYLVTLGIQFTTDFLRDENFYVVLSKDLKVLNNPTDLEKINSESNPDNYIRQIEEF